MKNPICKIPYTTTNCGSGRIGIFLSTALSRKSPTVISILV
jgi:hypothetical protein